MPGSGVLQGCGPQSEQDALLQKQLGYYQAWVVSLSQAPLQAVELSSVQSAVRVVVSGFSDTATAEDLRNVFEGLMAANHAAVAPGKAVNSCDIQPGSPASAVLQLRCSVEASNCLAFDGLVWNGAVLKVERPQGYKPEVAILLGPTQPNPAVCAAVAGSSAASASANGEACSHAVGSSFASAVRSASLPAGAGGPAGRTSAAGGAHAAGAGAGAGAAAGAACSKGGPRDLMLPADQSKQDEVFIGGLPSNWKAQQLKELLAPYGQLKSLSVAMDAATGKNKGYAFVVFASPDMVSHAIEELDCRVVEGKILAVQRATEGKACYGRESSGGGNDTGSLRDGGFIAPPHQHQHQPPAVLAPQQQQQPHQVHQQQQPMQQHQHAPPLLRHHHHRSSSTGSALPPHMPAPVVQDASGTASTDRPGPTSVPGAFTGHSRASSAGAPAGPTSFGPAPPPAADSSVLGPRPPPAGLAGSGGGAGGSMQHHSGPSSAKQYDINELYIGDLPLTWDEDAVRRLLGRFGRIKYFTLRNGRDKNFAFCKFKDSSVVDAAIAGLHGKIVDGYFLNVRRAIEGKQQNTLPGASPQTQTQWLTGKQPPMHQQQPQSQQQQQPNMRASFDATSTRANALTHRPRMSADQQQLSKLAAAATAAGPPLAPNAGGGKGSGLLGHPFAGPHGPRGNVLGSGGAAGHQQDRQLGGRPEQGQQQRGLGGPDAGMRGQQQQVLLQREHERGRACSPAAGVAAGPSAVAAAGAAGAPGKAQDATSAGSTAPSTPGTPTVDQAAAGQGAVPEQQQQQQQVLPQQAATPAGAKITTALPASAPGAAIPSLGYGPFMGPQLLPRPSMQQQQQQQQNIFQASSGYAAAPPPLFPPGPLPPPAQPGGGNASLFGPNGPASWPGTASLAAAVAAAAPTTVAGNLAMPGGSAGGAFSMGLGLKQQQQDGIQPGPATQAQSLLQTWDMLSPWSLFSTQ